MGLFFETQAEEAKGEEAAGNGKRGRAFSGLALNLTSKMGGPTHFMLFRVPQFRYDHHHYVVCKTTTEGYTPPSPPPFKDETSRFEEKKGQFYSFFYLPRLISSFDASFFLFDAISSRFLICFSSIPPYEIGKSSVSSPFCSHWSVRNMEGNDEIIQTSGLPNESAVLSFLLPFPCGGNTRPFVGFIFFLSEKTQ